MRDSVIGPGGRKVVTKQGVGGSCLNSGATLKELCRRYDMHCRKQRGLCGSRSVTSRRAARLGRTLGSELPVLPRYYPPQHRPLLPLSFFLTVLHPIPPFPYINRLSSLIFLSTLISSYPSPGCVPSQIQRLTTPTLSSQIVCARQ